jgi:acetoacetyl-CoA synthetase
MAEQTAPELLWEPSPEHVAKTAIARFREWLRIERGIDVTDYWGLWRWSVNDLDGFWSAAAEFCGVRFHEKPARALAERAMPGARWFPGATLNYAEQALAGRPEKDLAVDFTREDGLTEQLSYGALASRVAALRAGLVELGVGRGDRVVALAPNCPQTLVAFLAAASLGAVWSSCSPDFGARAIADRFVQIEPTVLVTVDGYVYGGKTYDVRETVRALRADMPSLAATVRIDYVGTGPLEGSVGYDELLDRHAGADLAFDAVEFSHPLWVLYSSGTTGLPKGIVQGHGGIVLEHLKAIVFQQDLARGSRFFWYTTTGWMMWNYLIAGLLAGATIVVYDGSPGYPDASALWRLAERTRIEYFGTSAPYVQSCMKKGLTPGAEFDLSSLRALGSTGSPLSSDGFRWIADEIGADVQICSVSGGTDLCTVLVGAAPDVPVRLGELSCAGLATAAAAFDEAGHSLVEQVGELVVTEPMPSMPLYLWNDPDGAKMHDAYFDMYAGIWRHGDWIRFTERGSAVIYGRSDSTLNRGGIRMGTAEFYRVVEGFDEVADSLVIDTTAAGVEGALLCFVVLAPGASLAEVEPRLRAALRAELSPRHVPNEFIPVDDVPRTLNGKKCEVPVKRILAGANVEAAVARDALANPDSLAPFVERAGQG